MIGYNAAISICRAISAIRIRLRNAELFATAAAGRKRPGHRGHVIAVWFQIALIAATIFYNVPLLAQTSARTLGKLELQLKTANAATRSDAPFVVEADLNSTFEEILDGELDLQLIDEELPRMRLRLGPIAIPNGHKSLRITLPAISADRFPADFVARVQFQTEKKTFDLGTHDLLVPTNGHRQFLIGALGMNEASITNLVHQLELDRYRPASSSRPALVTVSADFNPQNLSADPVGLYSYDILLLAGEHFSRLSAKSLETIAQWVAAGGGVAVIPTSTLTDAHKQFLARLTAGDIKKTEWDTDSLGRLPPIKPSSEHWLTMHRVNFGRAVIICSVPEVDRQGAMHSVNSERWKRAVCFLWNLRPKQAIAVMHQNQWQMPNDQHSLNAARALYGTLVDESTALCPVVFPRADELRKLLFPASVRVVPFSVVATILALFLLAIAPGDYFVLGLLRRRRFTWILFPTLCFCFTAATIVIANNYSGTVDHRNALVIVDVAENGEPLRTTRVEHVITAGTRVMTTDVKNGVFAMTDIQPTVKRKPASPKPAVSARPARGRNVMLADVDDEIIPYRRVHPGEPLDYAGTLPGSFAANWNSPQWTPQMHRTTTSKAAIDFPALPWRELDRQDPRSERGRAAIAQIVRRVVPDSQILILFGKKEFAYRSPSVVNPWGPQLDLWSAVLASLSRAEQRGLFSIVSQVSPNGDSSLEDLAVLDDSDPERCLIHVATRDGNDLVVFRHFLQAASRDPHDRNR